jgi:prevent-host-death family protein
MARGRVHAEARYRHELRPVAELRAGAARLVRAVRRTRRPLVLTKNGVPHVVLLDVASYSALRETALLLEVLALGRSEDEQPRRRRKRPTRR